MRTILPLLFAILLAVIDATYWIRVLHSKGEAGTWDIVVAVAFLAATLGWVTATIVTLVHL